MAGKCKGSIRGCGASQTLGWWSECQGIVRDISMPEHAYCRVHPWEYTHASECTHTVEHSHRNVLTQQSAPKLKNLI